MERRELLSQRSPEELGEALQRTERIIYTENGPRAAMASSFLRKIERLSSAMGIMRIAEISQLALTDFPVYQAVRPGLLQHAATGQNTGAQGKGRTHVQAKISCLMESVEAFCAEPRNPALVRGSFEFLKCQHRILHPDLILPRAKRQGSAARRPLLWTPAYHVEAKSRVLVPAEGVYFTIPTRSYGVPELFPQSTSGLASGATYLEAAVHGLYELIERMYIGLTEAGKIRMEAMFEEEFEGFDFRRFNAEHDGEFEFQLFALRLPNVRNLPMVYCRLVGDSMPYSGWGCAGSVDTAISRAISEAVQSYATAMSGGREDLIRAAPAEGRFSARPRARRRGMKFPEYRTLKISRYKKSIVERRCRTLNEEFDGIVSWLHALSFKTICIANLTRTGIDIPVVKAMVPQMPADRRNSALCTNWTQQAVLDLQYSIEDSAIRF